MTDPIIALLHSLIIGLVVYIVFKLIFRSPENFSQISSIIIACFSCVYLVSYDVLKKLI